MPADVSQSLPLPAPGGAPERGFRQFVPYFIMFMLSFTVLVSIGLGREGGTSDLLQGPDDFMRMVQVIDWIDGQGWSDTVQRRLNPPAGVSMHWSRLADIPLGAVIWLAEPWFGRARAVYLSALLIPPLLGGLFTALFLWAANPLIPDRRSPEPVLTIVILLIPLLQMRPGRIDHHGLQLVLTTLGIGCLIRAWEPGGFRAAVGLGLVGGASLAIGLEALPFLGAATVILSLAWVLRGGTAATALAIFGAVLAGTAFSLIPLSLAPAEWAAIVCDRMSLAHVAITAIVLAAGGAAVALERLRPAAGRLVRLAAVGGVGLAGLGLVATIFPQCAGSPYADLSAELRYWFDAVKEAQSLFDLYRREPGTAVVFVLLPLAALVSVVWQWARSADWADPGWIALLVLVLSGLALVAWQVRGVAYAGLVASLALIPLAARVNERADRSQRILARVGLRFCIPMIYVFAVVSLQLASSQPADEQKSECKVSSALAALTDPTGLGAQARTIAAPIDAGPTILFLSRHKVLAAPYHRNIQGLSDNRRIFAGTEEEALAMVRARDVEAILFCQEDTPITAYADRPAFLNDRLGTGRPPWWLVPVMLEDGLSLYQVRPAARTVQ